MARSGARAGGEARALVSLRALAPLGSAAAFSWPVLLAYCPLGLLIQAPGNISIYGGPAVLWFLASAIGMFSLALVLRAAHAASRHRGDPGAIAVLGCYAVGGIAQSVTFGLASVLVGAADSPHLGFRVSGLFLHLPLLTAVGYAVARHDGHQRIRAELEHTRDRLLSMGRSMEVELEQVEADLSDAVRRSLEPAVESLDAALAAAAAGAERADVLGEIDSLVEERVRPLAHDLVADPDADAEIEALDRLIERAERPRARVPLPQRFRLGEAIKPGLAGLVTVVGGLATAARALDPSQVLIYLSMVSLLTWGLFALARRALGSIEAGTAVGAPSVVLLHAALGSAAFRLTGAVGVTRPAGIASSWAAGMALLGAAVIAGYLVEARRARSEAELKSDADRLESALALVRRRERLVRRRLAFVVHGALQGALHSAAIRIAESKDLTDALGDEIRRDLAAALSQLDRSAQQGGGGLTSLAIEELASAWGVHRQFSSRVDEAVEESLLGDGDADEAVAEVVREAVNNAFRHGAASTVDVGLELATVGDDPVGRLCEIAIVVRDDGKGASSSVQPGLGSALFDDLCRSWKLEGDGSGTAFTARVALGAGIDPGGDSGEAAQGADSLM